MRPGSNADLAGLARVSDVTRARLRAVADVVGGGFAEVEMPVAVFLTRSRKPARIERCRTPTYPQLLRGAGLRVTRPRSAVLESVDARPHADTDSVIAAVRDTSPSVSHQAVYDSLRALTEAGLARRIQPAGSVARYEARVGDNHHHLVCRVCGTIADVDCAVGEVPCLTAADDHGFVIDEAEVIYWGTVPRLLFSTAQFPSDPSEIGRFVPWPKSTTPKSAT